jgi:hypothetical protein
MAASPNLRATFRSRPLSFAHHPWVASSGGGRHLWTLIVGSNGSHFCLIGAPERQALSECDAPIPVLKKICVLAQDWIGEVLVGR